MADFPTNISSDGSLYLLKNNVSSLLTSTISAAQASITLSSSSPFPPVGYVTVETEAIRYSANDTATGVLTVSSRGADSTTAAQHDAGLPVYHNYVANHHNAIKDEIIAIQTNLIQRLGSGSSAITVPASVSTSFNGSVAFNTTTTFNTKTSIQVGGSEAIGMTASGAVVFPQQPRFLAYWNSQTSNVTGDGTYYTLTAAFTEVFDNNNNLSTGVFVAPVNGAYHFDACILFRSMSALHSARLLDIVASGASHQAVHQYNLAETFKAITVSLDVAMSIGSTAYLRTFVDGSTKTVHIYGDNAVRYSFFSGHLIG